MELQRCQLAWRGAAAAHQTKDRWEEGQGGQDDCHDEFAKKICSTKHLWELTERFYLVLHVCHNFQEHDESCTVEKDQMS